MAKKSHKSKPFFQGSQPVIKESFTTDLVMLTTVEPLPHVVIHSSVKSIFRQYVAVSNGLLELFKPLSYFVSLVDLIFSVSTCVSPFINYSKKKTKVMPSLKCKNYTYKENAVLYNLYPSIIIALCYQSQSTTLILFSILQ